MHKIKIKSDYCKGCMLCIPVCPHSALEMSESLNVYGINIAAFKKDGFCSGCRNCATICPDIAIEVFKD